MSTLTGLLMLLTGSHALETPKPSPEEDVPKLLMIIFTQSAFKSNSSYHFMKPSKDLPGLLQHHSPIKQVTNFYTDPCWERLRLCRREHLGTKPFFYAFYTKDGFT